MIGLRAGVDLQQHQGAMAAGGPTGVAIKSGQSLIHVSSRCMCVCGVKGTNCAELPQSMLVMSGAGMFVRSGIVDGGNNVSTARIVAG